MKSTLLIVAVLVALSVGAQTTAPDMTVPKVEHKKTERAVQDDTVTRTCPAGYERHYVDVREGFDSLDYWYSNADRVGISIYLGENEPVYTVCFSKKFMDEVRKNRDLLSVRPSVPRGV